MKIKSITKAGPELFLVTFLRWFRSDLERYAIIDNTETVDDSGKISPITFVVWRDFDELAHECRPHIEWMIRNDVEFFDNTVSPDQIWPRPSTVTVFDTLETHQITKQSQALELSFFNGHVGGRRERDNELKPFFKAFEKFRKNDGVILSDLIQILNNLHPLDKS